MNIKIQPVWVAYAIIIVLIYAIQKYQVDYLDNAWSLSWAYGWWHGDGVFDHVFGYLDGDGGTSLFSRSYVFLYGALASLFGWTRSLGVGISSALILASGAVWYAIVRALGYKKRLALSYVLIMLILEAFFGIAQKIRVEALGFFLDSLAFLLFIRRRYVISGLILGLAFETHPFAAAAGFWMLAYLFYIRKDVRENRKLYWKRAGLFFLGLALGFAYWYTLHAPYLPGLSDLGNRVTGNALIYYYFKHRFSERHWPELIMILVALVFFMCQKRYLRHPFILPFTVSVLVFSLAVPRGNFHYVAYLYPAFVLLIVVSAEELNLLPWLMIAVLLSQAPQYAWLFWTQKGYQERVVRAQLTSRVPDDGLIIYGYPNAWFALKDRPFKAYGYFSRAEIPREDWPQEFYVLENKDYRKFWGESDLQSGADLYRKTTVDQWVDWGGLPIRLWKLSKKDDGK